MNYINESTRYTSDTLDKNSPWLDNPTVINLLVIALIVYAVFFAGRLDPPAVRFFDNPFVKIVAFLVIIYAAHRNIALAFALLIAFFSIYFKLNTSEGFHVRQDDMEYPSVSDYALPGATETSGDNTVPPEEQLEEVQDSPMPCDYGTRAPRGKLDVLENDDAQSNYAPASF